MSASGPASLNSGYRAVIRRGAVADAPVALSIIEEAAAWAAARRMDVWYPQELRLEDFSKAAAAAELVIGYADDVPAATMLLQAADPVYWPDEAPRSALYLHKVAVRRAFAGQSWLRRLVDFAAEEAQRARIARLRLDTIQRPKLRSMYEGHGFHVLDEPPLAMFGKTMIRMERVL